MVGFPGGVNAGTIYANLRLNSTLDKDVKVANSKMDKLGSKMKSLAVPAAAAAAAIALVGKASFNLAVDAGNAADRLLDLEQITGLSTTTLQEFSLVTSRAGVDFEQFASGIGTFERKLPELMEGTGRSSEMMDRLGVSIFDGAGNLRDMDDILPEILAAMSLMENETERNAIAMTLFGRNAEAMLPILALGAEGMKDAREEAHALGLVMGVEDLKAANNFRMEVDQLTAQLGAMSRDIGVDLIPVFRDLVDVLQWAVPHIKTVIKVGREAGKILLFPFVRFYEAIGKAMEFALEGLNKTIGVYNRIADRMADLGIEMRRLNQIDMSSPIEDLGRTTSTTIDDIVDDYNTAQAAMDEPLIPGWAGQTEYIKAELARTGARNIGELQEVYRGAPTPTAPTPTVYTGIPTAAAPGAAPEGTSAVSMLMSIDAGIQESNRLSEGIISAVQAIRITTGIGGFRARRGGDGDFTGDPAEVKDWSKTEMRKQFSLANVVGGI